MMLQFRSPGSLQRSPVSDLSDDDGLPQFVEVIVSVGAGFTLTVECGAWTGRTNCGGLPMIRSDSDALWEPTP